ncbi:MAG: GH92 family glycosyl hydrolase [Planctomycetes bacterium]|nr:GH92 family glycosyl hydrolase [Planctomycetota bacterium]
MLAGCASDGTVATLPSPGPDARVESPPFDPTGFVDPFVGTGGHGHTFPGATVPFGMVQVSPDTRLDGWDGCSGYHHDDPFIYGFSHTHLSGTGCSDYGDVLFMPGVGDVQWNNGADGKPGYRQHFSHANETASPGYYSVVLDDSGVKAEMTATTRVGVHRYTFPAGTKDANVVIDLRHRDDVIHCGLQFVGDREIRGFRWSKAWATDQRVYFVARFSRPFVRRGVSSYPEAFPVGFGGMPGFDEGVAAAVAFPGPSDEPLVVKVGISGVDAAGAAKNLDAEMPGFDFDAARSAARETWRSQLGKIEVHGGTDAQRRTFYSSLYHCCIAPNVWSDVDGRYRARNMRIHETDGWTQYTVFSLWDTFRALHPLMTILEPERTNDWINTFLAQHREGGALPVWELAANETDCMIGYHAVPVIADAYAKGIRGYDTDRALAAMADARPGDAGLEEYRWTGYVRSETEGESVSKTLEYAYDDWCIAEMAASLGRTDVESEFRARSHHWRNLFDPKTGFFRARRNGAWIEPFDPAEVNFHLTEANSWQYSTFVPHDIAGLTAMLGGREALAARLDAMFAAPSKTTGREQADITGLIGQYAHGNEPSHHMAYLYDYVGQPWKTQARVRQIVDTLYADRPDGLCGNEDCGQMSAWYVFSALGLYPVCPGIPEYAIGSPLFPEARIAAANGRTFTIRTSGAGPYVQSAVLNGAPLRRTALAHETLVAGGLMEFVLGPGPSVWGTAPEDAPRSGDAGPPPVPVPFVVRGDRTFRDATEVALAVADAGATIRYVIDEGGLPARHLPSEGRTYEAPLRIDRDCTIQFWAERDGVPGRPCIARFARTPHDRTIKIAKPYAPQFAANGDVTLIDGLRGGTDFRTGDWQGYQGVDLDVTIDLGAEREIKQVRAGFLQDMGSWIWMPTLVEVFVAAEANGPWTPIRDAVRNDVDEHAAGAVVKRFETGVRSGPARYVRVLATNRTVCPPWHPGAGHKAWLFADEIEIETAE